MSGMDRLADEAWDGPVTDEYLQWVSEGEIGKRQSMARELLAHRRASQAAPAPKDNDAIWAAFYRDGLTLEQVAEKFGLTIYDLSPWLYRPLMRMPDPAPSDGLREAVPLGLVEALRSGRQADMDGVMVTVSRQACEMAADMLSALTPAPAQEEEPRHD